MPIEEFALDTIGTRRAQFFRDEEGKNYTVLLDQVILGSFSNQEELAAGREFALADGSILKVRLVNGRAEMTRNGQLLPSMSAGEVRKAKAQSEAVGEQKSLLARFFTHPTVWGLGFVVGCLLIIGGVIFIHNTTSTYSSVQGRVVRIGLAQACASSPQTCPEFDVTLDFPSTVYPIIFADYRPRPTTNVVGFGANVTFVYRNDALAGLKVVQITSTDNNGQNAEVFTAPEYTSYLQTERDAGVREGIVVIVVGVVIAILALTIPIVSRRRVGLRQAKR